MLRAILRRGRYLDLVRPLNPTPRKSLRDLLMVIRNLWSSSFLPQDTLLAIYFSRVTDANLRPGSRLAALVQVAG